jgi:hypothetical protein
MDPHATEPHAALLNEFVEEILELSARAHVRRRTTAKDSPEFHTLTGAISAYGNVLALITALRRLEEFYAKAAEQVPDYSQWVS